MVKNFKISVWVLVSLLAFVYTSVALAEDTPTDTIPEPTISTPEPAPATDPAPEPEALPNTPEPNTPSDPSTPDPNTTDPNTNTQTPPPPTPQVTVFIRNGDTLIHSATIDLPAPGTMQVLDSANVSHDINTQSVLGVIKVIDDTNDAFQISNLQYYDSFGSFYLKCITSTAGSELCDNWQYAVGALTPYSSIENTILSGGETVGIYFGYSHRVLLSSNSVEAGQSFTATAQAYSYTDDTWLPLTWPTIGITVPNPNDPWSPTVVASSLVDTNGVATFTLTNPGSYSIGIVEDFYYPSFPLTISLPVNNSTSGNSGGTMQKKSFSIPSALAYLTSNQLNDGSFAGSSMYTDWATIALASNSIDSNVKNKIIDYMKSKNKISSTLTDNERRAMAILALGENPYNFDGTNYIESIIKEFDGTQFGDSSLVNDDIFAVIVLGEAGYNQNDTEIVKALDFIISKQKSNGSWEESVDMTGAGLQALAVYSGAPAVAGTLANASAYLESMQSLDGGWINASATAWAMQGGTATGKSFIKGNSNGTDFLANLQQNDGGVLADTESLENRIWATSYAIPAVAGKTWAQIMHSVSKQEIQKEEKETNTDTKDQKAENIPEEKIEIQKEKSEENILTKENTKKDTRATTKEVVVKESTQTENQTEVPLVADISKAKTKIPTPYVFGGAGVLIGAILAFRVWKK